ncbi:polysaccharide deacetylase family protein [Seohaeicola zhoushanensis]|uniref:Polysaccharide deacetylase n=1 Tax=Seohaeicola zhoushanensis TaxID=1569283 RepID=A0A8J3GVL4_9RHOB|nr:polysaccharide deacetylase family protein [Seohaeicola zhoushanensis]GHF40031.1 polysaccharide deacetylase [Seohaeicola zhoushanensis]
MSWRALGRELAHWRRDSLDLPLWWRDDDAVAPGAALDRLLATAAHLEVTPHLAVIPAAATEALAAESGFVAMVHGWQHRNHAPEGEKKAEFRAHRPLPDRLDEAQRGLARLTALFGPRACPVFVPPWNRIDEDMTEGLAALGYRGLSAFGPRSARATGGLVQVNTHLDPIDWRGTRSLVDPAALLAQVTRQLADRREGRADAAEPYGLLTHHLVHDAPIWEFSTRFMATLLDAGARPLTLDTETLP